MLRQRHGSQKRSQPGRNGFYVDQFHALEGKSAHETGTAQELLDAAGGLIDGWTCPNRKLKFGNIDDVVRQEQGWR
jgi:hypothetical protein